MRRIIPLCVCVAALAHICVMASPTISSSGNTEFFVTPPDVLHSIPSMSTPGSADFIQHSPITVTDGGALYSILNGLLERKYYFSKGMKDEWDHSKYGPTLKQMFWFDGGTLFTDRTTAYTKGIVGLGRMNEFNNHCDVNSSCMREFRPSWNCDLWKLGSSRLRLNTGKKLDDGKMPAFDWMEIRPNGSAIAEGEYELGEKCRSYMWIIDNLEPQYESCGFFTKALSLIGYDNPYIEYAIEDSDIDDTSYSDAVENYFGHAAVYSGDLNISNKLEKSQPWMSKAAQYLAPLDRVYTASSAGGATNVEHHALGTSRNGSVIISVSGTRDSDDSIVITPIHVYKRRWSIGYAQDYDAVTNKECDCNHSRKIDISAAGKMTHMITAPYAPSSTIDIMDAQGFKAKFADYMIIGTNEVSIQFLSKLEFGTASDRVLYMVNGSEIHEDVATQTSFDNVPVVFVSTTSRAYTYDYFNRKTIPIKDKFRPMSSPMMTGKYTAIGSYLISFTNSIPIGQDWFDDRLVLGFKATSGSGYGYSLQNNLDAIIDDVGSKMMEEAKSSLGDFTVADDYIGLSDVECQCDFDVSEGHYGCIVSNSSFCVNYDGGNLYDMYLIDETTNKTIICEGQLADDFEMYSIWNAIGVYPSNVEWSAPESTNKAVSVYGSAAIIQRQDFAFTSLKPGDVEATPSGSNTEQEGKSIIVGPTDSRQ